MFGKIRRLTREQVRRRGLFLDLAGRTEVLIAGSGRSGTTWIEEVINFRGDHRIIFEPFRTTHVPEVSHFKWKQYIRPTDPAPEFLMSVRRIMDGTIRNPWVDQTVNSLVYWRRMVKAIRANLLLAWLQRQMPDLAIVLLLRHPCAVAASQVKLGWNPNPRQFFEQQPLVDDVLAPFVTHIESAESHFENAVVTWCIDNYVPLTLCHPSRILTLFYEHVVLHPKRELERLFTFLGRTAELDDPRLRAALSRPSRQTRQGSAPVTREDIAGAWRKNVSPQEAERAIELIKPFGLDALYTTDPLPQLASADGLPARFQQITARPGAVPS